jgi:archaellum component FlaC
LQEQIKKIEQEIKWLKRDIKDLTAEFSTSVSMRDFASVKAKILTLEEEVNELKAKVGLTN